MSRSQKEVPKLNIGEVYNFTERTKGTRLTVEWISVNGIICDLDLVVYIYDERARFIEKLTFDNPASKDSAARLEADIDSHTTSTSHEENVYIDLTLVSPQTSAILIFIDGGSRNFQFVQNILCHCSQENKDTDDVDFNVDGNPNSLLFQTNCRSRKDFQGVAALFLFKDGWKKDGSPCWSAKNVFEPFYVATSREKEEKCIQLLVQHVPALAKYRPRLFQSVKTICSALSSTSLPMLKKSFLKDGGLPLRSFTEVIFKQLCETHPRVLEESEAAYTVAMLQDMFNQIDFNGDGTVDWDEFTTFCIHTGLVTSAGSANSGEEKPTSNTLIGDGLDNYVIEYAEDLHTRENILSTYTPINTMKYLPDHRRIMIVQSKSDKILMFNESFELQAELDSVKLVALNSNESDGEASTIYDVVYLPCKDLYCYTSSDHSIVFCREHSSLGGRRVHYTVYNRIYHKMVHLKLCWSDKNKILCTVAADNVIYGWDTDGQTPLFHLTRHKDLITDFIPVDDLDLYITCSLDKRIVLWSMTTRRVKGVLLGHKRGVRCISYAKEVLLSAGFECEAKTWDINLKEPTLILRGHRRPISAVKMMCVDGAPDDQLHAITVDDSGEFRLWNVYVKEKSSICGVASSIQVFHAHVTDPEVPKSWFIELPYDPNRSRESYSNLIAASSKLVHFTPEKNSKEFVPPTCTIFNEAAASMVTAIGKSLYKYDLSAGTFATVCTDLASSDLTCVCLDGEIGRRLYVGCNNGQLLLINYATGQIIDSLQAHTKEITSIAVFQAEMRHVVVTGSLDGRIRVLEENSGSLAIHNTADNALGDGCGIIIVKAVPSLQVIVAASGGSFWGIWNSMTLKKIFILKEENTICSIEIIGASNDKQDIEQRLAEGETTLSTLELKNHFITAAIALPTCIRIYTVDTVALTAIITHSLEHFGSTYFNGLVLLHCPLSSSVNYSMVSTEAASSLGDILIASSDEGHVVSWDANNLREASTAKHKQFYRTTIDREPIAKKGGMKKSSLSRILTKQVTMTSIREGGDDEFENRDGERKPSADKEGHGDIFSLTQKIRKRYGRRGSKKKALLRTLSSMSLHEACQKSVAGVDDTTEVLSDVNWMAHGDTITSLVPLHEHGCFVSVSLDGYHRVWNMEADCLGELALPNITEKMRKTSIYRGSSGWKFILEKIAVTEAHVRIAKRLIKNARSGSIVDDPHEKRLVGLSAKEISAQSQISHEYRIKTLGHSETVSIEALEKKRLRLMALKNIKSGIEVPPSPVAKIRLSPIKSSKNVFFSPGGSVDESTSSPDASRRQSKMNSSQSSASLWQSSEVVSKGLPSPFSESSLLIGHNEGLLDVESHRLLRKIGTRSDKIDAYKRSYPPVLLRNANLSASVEVPTLDNVNTSEVSFGDQKDLYKNATTEFNVRQRISKSQARHIVTMSRIKNNVKRVGNMVDVNKDHNILPEIVKTPKGEEELQREAAAARIPNSHSEEESTGGLGAGFLSIYETPSKEDSNSPGSKNRSDGFGSTYKLPVERKSNRTTLDKEKVEYLMQKIQDANVVAAHTEESLDGRKKKKKKGTQAMKRLDSVLKSEIASYEKKLSLAIKNLFNDNNSNAEKKTLNTRMLLPFYKMADIKHFVQIFQKVDEDYSGALDANEWVKFFTTLNRNVTQQQARTIFMQVDKNNDGLLSFKDLIPVVFSNASKEQVKMIIRYVDAEITKRKVSGKEDLLTLADLEALFEYYDTEVIGFLPISVVKEKIRTNLNLPDHVQFAVLNTMKDIADDEMVNLNEFQRVFARFVQ